MTAKKTDNLDEHFIAASEEDNGLIVKAHSDIEEARTALGRLREGYLRKESDLVDEIQERSKRLEYMVQAIAARAVADRPGEWDYDPGLGGFSKLT